MTRDEGMLADLAARLGKHNNEGILNLRRHFSSKPLVG
jgi:hypothetical protein